MLDPNKLKASGCTPIKDGGQNIEIDLSDENKKGLTTYFQSEGYIGSELVRFRRSGMIIAEAYDNFEVGVSVSLDFSIPHAFEKYGIHVNVGIHP